jgi:hypothetical protein
MLEKLISFCSAYQIKKYVIFMRNKKISNEKSQKRAKLKESFSVVLKSEKSFIKYNTL